MTRSIRLLVFLLIALPCRGAIASATVGQSVTLAVTADGTAPFTYQWFKDGVAIDGATAAAYSLTAHLVDAGTYTVQVSNSAGSTTSDTATLTITPMLATLSASVTTINYPAPTLYVWRKNGQTIASGPTLTFDPSVSPGSYSITITFPNPPPLK